MITIKATGLVRRLDDLGRIVIPKEVRRTCRMREGDPLEIFLDHDGMIILKKYSPLRQIETVAGKYAKVISQQFGVQVFITDVDSIIAAGKSNGYVGRPINEEITKIILARITTCDSKFPIIRDTTMIAKVILPVCVRGDVLGSIIIMDDVKVDVERMKSVAEIISGLIQSELDFE